MPSQIPAELVVSCIQNWRIPSDEITEHDPCPLCREGYCEDLHAAIELRCGHLFGEECILHGLQGDNTTYPVCRLAVFDRSDMMECPLCLEEYNETSHPAVQLPCGDCFGADCLVKLFEETDLFGLSHSTCPTCEMALWDADSESEGDERG